MPESLTALKTTYRAIEKRLDTLDFSVLWPGFKPFPFALYNDDTACLSTGCIPRPASFMGNTAIVHENAYLAIWYLQDARDLDRLTALIVHEMFHAFQQAAGETRFPNEIEAVFTMQLDETYLDLKQAEHQALVNACRHKDMASWHAMRAWRKTRQLAYPHQSTYENQVEVIEGTAHYVELQALKQLDMSAYTERLDSMQEALQDPTHCLPIRPRAYVSGALLLEGAAKLDVKLDKRIGLTDKTYADMVMGDLKIAAMPTAPQAVCGPILIKHRQAVEARIASIIANPEWVREARFTLRGCNVYDAQYVAPHLWTSYFVMLQGAGEPFVEHGTFVCEMEERTVVKLYKARPESKAHSTAS
ncbi:MAG: hypothetical protein EA374_08425 [Acholeplasmatales bacterium]|nr:MAG: hypothetical protein EA374_08425 [Acholeplasmatales bacterium]